MSGKRKPSSPLRVAVVDDSSFVRRAIARMLKNDARIEIVGQASSGEELLANLETWAPDVITLDLSMPGMGGLPTLDRVMALRPTPVIILSTHSAKDAPQTIEALHRGALDFIDKQQYSLVDFEALRAVILEKLLSVMGGSLPPTKKAPPSPPPPSLPEPPEAQDLEVSPRFDLLLIGASTGGPPTIQRLLEDLGHEVPVPVVIVQHMPEGFTRAFAERLNSHLPVQVREAGDEELLEPSVIYLAPAGQHLRIVKREGRLYASLSLVPEGVTHRPSVDVLFDSAADVVGRRSLGVLLTGMGSDGAAGMARLAAARAYTVTQDEKSCVVYGMPRAAVQLRAVRKQVPLEEMGEFLSKVLRSKVSGPRKDD